MDITRLEHVVKVVEEESPEHLLGMDEYALGCQSCPTDYPKLVMCMRVDKFDEIASDVLDNEQEMYSEVLEQVKKWLSTLGLEDECTAEDDLWLVRTHDGLAVLFSEKFEEGIIDRGINPDIFMTSFNDRLIAMTAERISSEVTHAYESHPGKVTCGGPIEVGGRMACGASLERVDCPSSGNADYVIELSALRSVQAAFDKA